MSTVEVVPAAQAGADPEVAAMIALASNDHDLCQATYLPAGLDEAAAVRWIGARVEHGWAILLDGEPVGWAEIDTVKDSCGFDLPAGSAEFEIWLLPHARGKRLFRRSLAAIEEKLLTTEVAYIVGVAWATNHASIKAMRNTGFKILGDGWWGDLTAGGLCTVGILRLGNHWSEPAST